jgi:hypothetical protein
MAVIEWFAFLEIECDYPGCEKRIVINDQCPGPMFPDERILKSLGWEMSIFPSPDGSNGFITMCPDCKGKELPADINKNDHSLADALALIREYVIDGRLPIGEWNAPPINPEVKP